MSVSIVDSPEGEEMLAHESQLFPVPDELNDLTATLVEPLAVGAHAALGVAPVQDEPVLVIGSGPIALGAVWALKRNSVEVTKGFGPATRRGRRWSGPVPPPTCRWWVTRYTRAVVSR